MTDEDELNTEQGDPVETPDPLPRRSGSWLVTAGIVAAAIILVVIFLYLRLASSPPETEKKADVVVSVKTAKVELGPIAREFTAVGTVAPGEQSTVAASISAQIRQMRLLKNTLVQKGEVLAVLASQDIAAQRAEAMAAVEEAKLNLQTLQNVTIPQTSAQIEKDLSDARANADNARATYERRKELFNKGGISLKDLDASQLALTNAENALSLAEKNAGLSVKAINPNARAIAENKIKQAESRLRQIETQAGYAEIKAPFAGIITDQYQFEGDFASQGAKLLTIAEIGNVIVKADFSDTAAQFLKDGDMVQLRSATIGDDPMTGKVTLVSRSADPQNRTVEVWANFANGRGTLRPGDSVTFVVSSTPQNDAVIVPVAAVQLDAANSDEGTVMVVDKLSVAHETKVKIGIRTAVKYEITEGLKGGETIVVEGNYALPDGTHVEEAKDEPANKGSANDTDR